jgi:hypothetical protein
VISWPDIIGSINPQKIWAFERAKKISPEPVDFSCLLAGFMLISAPFLKREMLVSS